MFRRIVVYSAVLCAALVFSVGCNKKVVKVEANAGPQASASKAPEPSVQALSDSFETVALNAKMKGIFVPIYFKFNDYSLSDVAIASLGKIGSFLQQNPDVRILIEGNADEIGSDEYNMGLGERRARASKEYLVTYGIKGDRLEITSYGKERPAVPNCPVSDDICRGKNRRDEWKALAK
jgi:peptidoglycan-associated lipoprotein